MGEEIFNQYFKYSTEQLRLEMCLDNVSRFKTKKSQLLDKMKEVKEMLEKQEPYMEMWE